MRTTDELFLLLTTDDGRLEGMSQRGFGLTASLLADLVEAGRLHLSDDRDPKAHLVDSSPTGDPVLDHGVLRLVQKRPGTRLSSLVADRKLNPEPLVVVRLQGAGVVGHEPKRMLGLVPDRYPTLDPGPEAHVRSRLAAVLAGAQVPSRGDATILSVLQGLGVAHRVLKAEAAGRSSRELKKRVEEVVASTPAGDAVGRAVSALNTAMITAVVIPVVVAGGSS